MIVKPFLVKFRVDFHLEFYGFNIECFSYFNYSKFLFILG